MSQLATAFALLASIAVTAVAADSIAWDSAVNGLRLGIRVEASSTVPALVVSIQNVGTANEDVLIGNQVGNGVAPAFRFFATSPEGTAREGFELNSFTPIAGLVVPIAIQLKPSQIHESRFALARILCVEKPGNITFDSLVKQGFSLRVSLDGDAKAGAWAGLSSPWIGRIVSAEISPR